MPFEKRTNSTNALNAPNQSSRRALKKPPGKKLFPYAATPKPVTSTAEYKRQSTKYRNIRIQFHTVAD